MRKTTERDVSAALRRRRDRNFCAASASQAGWPRLPTLSCLLTTSWLRGPLLCRLLAGDHSLRSSHAVMSGLGLGMGHGVWVRVRGMVG